jgi:putative spermidine/putrescine transport system permease protein
LVGQKLSSSKSTLIAPDGEPLKLKLKRTTRAAKRRALFFTLPLLIFILISFVLPIGEMLFRSLYNPAVSRVMPNFAGRIVNWNGQRLPSDEILEIFCQDLVNASRVREIGQTVGNLATRINYELPGSRSLIVKTARKLKTLEQGPYKEALLAIDERWQDPVIWRVLRRASSDFTVSFYLTAMDLRYDSNEKIIQADKLYRIYLPILWKTLWLSALISLLCFILAYPTAFLLSSLPLRASNLLMILVLLPFWTSLLVRTTAWIAMLQTQGVINDTLVNLGFITSDGRIQMIYNRTGTMIAMVHILLPFMILPLYSVMKTISPSYLRAARSLGASHLYAFVRVYFPLTLPGVAAGTLLVFILAIGYYITPALVGGNDGLLISNLIADHIKSTSNWSLGAALGTMLLVIVLILYWIYNRLIGINKLSFG